MHSHFGPSSEKMPGELCRRELLIKTGQLGLAGAGMTLAGFAWATDQTQLAPVKGGTLTMAIAGAGEKQTLDPHFQVSGIEFVSATNIYDRLAERLDGKINYRLATAMERNQDGTKWTIKLRPGVKWHDGSTFSARDVLYTWRRMTDDHTGDSAALSPIDLVNVQTKGDLELEVPTKYPISDLPELFVSDQMQIIRDGTKTFNPANGTGPFKLKSFDAGRQFVLVRNEDYWELGLPYLDEVIVVSIDDASGRINAIHGAQADIASGIPPAQARALAPKDADLSKAAILDSPMGLRLVNSAAVLTAPFVMDTSKAPFDDVNVRKALKLAVDRKRMVQAVYAGFAGPGNDMFGLGYEGYPDVPQTTYDPDQAKSLLAKAGHSRLPLEIVVTAGETGQLEAATVLQQTAKAAGIDLTIRNVPTGDFWSSYWMQVPFFPTWWTRKPFATQYGQSMAVGAPYNEARWDRPDLDEKFRKAQGTLDDAVRAQMYADINKVHHEEGGHIITTWSNPIDLVTPRVQGIRPTGPNALGDYRLRMIWLAQAR